MTDTLLDLTFDALVVAWRGPAPFVFAAIPAELTAEIREAARAASYGWGCVPVAAEVGGAAFTTSLFPRDGGYMLLLKIAVRRATGVVVGDEIRVAMQIEPRPSCRT